MRALRREKDATVMNTYGDDWTTACGYTVVQDSIESADSDVAGPTMSRVGLLILPMILLTATLIGWLLTEPPLIRSEAGDVIYITGPTVSRLGGGEAVILDGEVVGEVAEVNQRGSGMSEATLVLQPEVFGRLHDRVGTTLSTLGEWWLGDLVVVLSVSADPEGNALQPGAKIVLEGGAMSGIPWKFWLIIGGGAFCLSVVFIYCIKSLKRAFMIVCVLQGLVMAAIGGVWLYVFVS